MWSVRQMILVGALAASTTVGGCAGRMTAGDSYENVGFGGAAARVQTALVVENNNWQDMTVYLLRDGFKTRLGSVSSLSRQRFVLTSAIIAGAGTLRIVADPIGSNRAWVSEPFLIQTGDEVRFKLENNISLSSYMIY